LAGLTDKAGGPQNEVHKKIEQAQQAWQESMLRQVETLRASIREETPELIAQRTGAEIISDGIQFPYWNRLVSITWPELQATMSPDEDSVSVFDAAMLMYYLHTADGAPLADSWIGFRELPDGAFYAQAFQGYSGNRVAQHFGSEPNRFHAAAQALDGWRLSALAEHAYAFRPLPRIRLAAVLWPGDEEFPSKASILFDGASHHYMTTDGLALLGAGLARRLEKADK
jgi:hypothetical protein